MNSKISKISKMLKKLCVILACGFFVFSGCATGETVSRSSPPENVRLWQAMAKLRRGETVNVVAIGGSITTGHQARPPAQEGWAGQVNRWWQEKAAASGATVVFRNAGASGTDSAFASIRVKDHALAWQPDVVFVEFAVNDQWLNARVRQRSYEGLLRQLLSDSSRSVIILALNEKANPNKSARSEEEKIGKHYGLPTLAWADWVKLADWDRYFSGSEAIHPNNEGHANIALGVNKYLEAVWKSLPPEEGLPAVETALPPPLVSAEFQNVTLLGGGDSDALLGDLAASGWKTQTAILPDEWITRGGGPLSGWTTNDPNAVLSVRVKGKSAGVLFTESDQYRNGLAWIEESGAPAEAKKVIINTYVSYRSGYYGYAYAEIADGLDPAKEYILRLAVNPGGKQGAWTNIIGVVCTNP